MWESIVPDHFRISGLVVSNEEMVQRMKDVAVVYSKGRGKKANAEWEEDSTKVGSVKHRILLVASIDFFSLWTHLFVFLLLNKQKQTTAIPEVLEAARVFLGDTFAKLEELSKSTS